MALHPFQFFRKRQKTMLSILTILAMFIFILTGFSGSIVDKVGYWFGGTGRRDKTEVTTLYGKSVTVSDLDQLQQDRRLADAFIKNAILSAQPHLSEAEHQEVFGRIIDLMRQDPFGGQSSMRAHLLAYRQELIKANKTEAARFVQHWLRGIELNGWAQSHSGQLYFGGGTTPDDLLDFQIWRKEADKLNVNLTDEDLRKSVNHEADNDVLSGDPVKDGEKVRLYVQAQNRNADPKGVLAALREEFRVRLAKEVLLGSAAGARAAMGGGLAGDEVPAAGTPEEFWDFYKDNRTTLNVAFLKVPVSQFTGQVKKEPTDDELKNFFNRYKNDEPSPDRATPGFKVPRKVKVEWVAADAESKHYREAAEKALPLLNDAQALTLLSVVPAGIGTASSPVGVYASLALPSVKLPQLQFEYETYVKGVKSWWDASNVTPEGNNPYATGVDRPETRAAVAGQLIGAALTGATPWSVEGTLGGAIAIQRAEQRARSASMVLAGASPFPLGVAAQEAALANVRVPPLSAVRDDLNARIRDRIGPDMAGAALQAFVKDLDAKRFNPKDAAEYVEKNANIEHGITGGNDPKDKMKEPRAQTDIADDPALAPLRRAFEASVPLTPTTARQFAEKFFTTTGNDGKPTQTQPYHPAPFRGLGETTYYYWLTESEKPKVLTFAEAKPQVEAAWKFNQARKDARAAAEHVIDAVKKRGEGISADRFLKDEAARLKYDSFDVLGIAKLVRSQEPLMRAGFTTLYEPYKFPETTPDKTIVYPRSDSVDELFKALNQPGAATVIADRPERNYYVAVLEARKVPTEKDFFVVYQKAPRGFLSDSLWLRFQTEREQKYRTQVVRHLREEALAPLDEQGNYRIDPDVRRRLRGGPGSEE